VQHHRAEIERLLPVVGDPEDAPNRIGHLPRDRRFSTLYEYRQRRIAEVRHLQKKAADLNVQMKATDDGAGRSKLRAERDVGRWRLDKLLAVPRLDAEDMCAECATPASHHGYVSPPYHWPCPAWPVNASHLKRFREMLDEMVLANEARKAAAGPEPLKPEPRSRSWSTTAAHLPVRPTSGMRSRY